MAFCITFGTQEFTSQLKGYEGVTAQCRNCGNWSAHCISRWPWFTICFIPAIPLATHKYQEVTCNICHFNQDLSHRPDVQQQQGQGGQQQQQQYQQQQQQQWQQQQNQGYQQNPQGGPQYVQQGQGGQQVYR